MRRISSLEMPLLQGFWTAQNGFTLGRIVPTVFTQATCTSNPSGGCLSADWCALFMPVGRLLIRMCHAEHLRFAEWSAQKLKSDG